jgi:hypothetical protein
MQFFKLHKHCVGLTKRVCGGKCQKYCAKMEMLGLIFHSSELTLGHSITYIYMHLKTCNTIFFVNRIWKSFSVTVLLQQRQSWLSLELIPVVNNYSTRPDNDSACILGFWCTLHDLPILDIVGLDSWDNQNNCKTSYNFRSYIPYI